jgi:hypothetical protein
LEVPASFFEAEREADFDAERSGDFRLLLGWEVLSFFVLAIVILSSSAAASRSCRGTLVLSEDNDDIAVPFARVRSNGLSGGRVDHL